MIIQADRIDNNKSDLFDALLHRKLLSLEKKGLLRRLFISMKRLLKLMPREYV